MTDSGVRVCIAGRWEKTKNYRKVLEYHGMLFDVCDTDTDPGEFDALLLPGGGDIEPSLYGQENCYSKNIDAELDLVQLALLNRFYSADKPVLGICKGIQVINIFFGGSLCQHMSACDKHISEQGDISHVITTVGEPLFCLYGKSMMVNSCHHQSIATLGENLRALQYSEDGEIEAVAHTGGRIIGVQWHPERMSKAFVNHDWCSGDILFDYYKKCIIKCKEKY